MSPNRSCRISKPAAKDDLLVSQLLTIAQAFRVTPIFLLAPIATSSVRLDIANLSSSFDDMTVVQFDAWISGEPNGAYDWNTLADRAERTQLHDHARTPRTDP
jgi:hypothetical protein